MTKSLRLVLTDHWFEEIKSGRKTSEYRKDTDYWAKRLKTYIDAVELMRIDEYFWSEMKSTVVFQKAYRKNPELMEFEIENIIWHSSGIETDLKTEDAVFEIKLGRRLK